MLTHLAVRDLAIVDNLELELAAGMTVFTGETGAGKSLLIDALDLAIGERCSASLVRAGAPFAEVSAEFEPGALARAWLEEHALTDADGQCLLRRVVSAEGRSRAFVNGRPVPLAQLKSLGERLVDVHGQHAHQSLLRPAVQRSIVDEHGDHDSLLDAVSAAYADLRESERELDALQRGTEDAATRLDYLAFQIDELEALSLDENEPERLASEHRRLAHGAELIGAAQRAAVALEDDELGVSAALERAVSALAAAQRIDPAVEGLVGQLNDARALLAEAVSDLRRYAATLDLDESRLSHLDQRLAAIQDLARKHRCAPDALAQRLRALRDEAEDLRTRHARIEQTRARLAQLLTRYSEAASTLSRSRQGAALALAGAANEVLGQLGMKGARLEVTVQTPPAAAPSRHGTDRIDFLVSTNPGQPPLPLSRIASGGELSRIALAIQSVALGESGVPTAVFDEVDTGVGGGVAETIGRLMRTLGERRQLLAVTHMAQVAALAHQHVRIYKAPDTEGGVRTRIEPLDEDSRVAELARMVGGLQTTETTLAHAREMLHSGREAAPSPRRSGRRPAA